MKTSAIDNSNYTLICRAGIMAGETKTTTTAGGLHDHEAD